MDRRSFLKQTGAAAGAMTVGDLRGARQEVSIVVDPQDSIASGTAPSWAIRTFQDACAAQGVTARVYPRSDAAPAGDKCIIVAGADNAAARQIQRAARVSVPSGAEVLCLVPGSAGGRSVLLAAGTDARGLVYAVLELADRVKYGTPLEVGSPIIEKPANTIRSCARCFVSDVEDKAWFYDHDLWMNYLTMLATNRFNRFNLTLGIGYNSAGTPGAGRRIPDSYFCFPYPFLLAVPGYDVKAVGLPDAERDHNLETLKFIGEQTLSRGLQFNLGLWTHGYDWPGANYEISGLTPETHPVYCRDALAALLKACPGITGLSFRIHSESGVPNGRYDFWETLFTAIKNCGRKIDIDMHAKNTTERHIEIGLATGNPVSMATKYWAEHNGMPYNQASIREQEFRAPAPRPGQAPEVAAIAARNFLRYSFGDYLKDTRKYGLIHRVWPGTQRHLIWGDPAWAAGYGRAFGFAGILGFETFEPLSFRGRGGSGEGGSRLAYADKSLEPKWDWQKYEYQYRVMGRLTYDPGTDPDGYRRYLRKEFEAAAQPMESALGNASRILPLITSTHDPGVFHGSYWPEMYTNMPIVDEKRAKPYTDTPAPFVFGTVSSLDPQLFSTVNECADALLSGQSSAKYTPLEVAQWLEDMAARASQNKEQAIARAPKKDAPELRRMAADIAIQAGTGRFFAFKLRSAVLWRLYQSTGDRTALTEALRAYRIAREAWVSMAEGAKGVYKPDIIYGPNAIMRGHWLDRTGGIDADIGDMEAHLADSSPLTPAKAVDAAATRRAIAAVLARPKRLPVTARHTPAERFVPGKPLEVSLTFSQPGANREVSLLYRQVDQSQSWRSVEMERSGHEFRGSVPADYTQSPFPIQYYFEVHESAGSTIVPGFNQDLSNHPFILVRSSAAVV